MVGSVGAQRQITPLMLKESKCTMSYSWLKPWSAQQLMSTPEAVTAAEGGASGDVEGPQAPGKIEHFALGKRSQNASITHHFNQRITKNSMR